MWVLCMRLVIQLLDPSSDPARHLPHGLKGVLKAIMRAMLATFFPEIFARTGQSSCPRACGRLGWYGIGLKILLDVARGLAFLHSRRVRIGLAWILPCPSAGFPADSLFNFCFSPV